jgi:hypothetical protein
VTGLPRREANGLPERIAHPRPVGMRVSECWHPGLEPCRIRAPWLTAEAGFCTPRGRGARNGVGPVARVGGREGTFGPSRQQADQVVGTLGTPPCTPTLKAGRDSVIDPAFDGPERQRDRADNPVPMGRHILLKRLEGVPSRPEVPDGGSR